MYFYGHKHILSCNTIDYDHLLLVVIRGQQRSNIGHLWSNLGNAARKNYFMYSCFFWYSIVSDYLTKQRK